MEIAERAARMGLTVERTRLPAAVPAIVIGEHVLVRPDASDADVAVALAGEMLRREGVPFAASDARAFGSRLSKK